MPMQNLIHGLGQIVMAARLGRKRVPRRTSDDEPFGDLELDGPLS
jgi:hypothetical protein